ncbi:helix-turn-helix domain-containing protein [Actinoplanes rectilineatus]|uniref:helix-turn-helix domain-containing protein n=1 Tax=Actinoplanes rectilineatus TaxID=113571 RepID=UPI0005F28742|nr:helix-turn-helix transcriptional regulator [Actinoplanes rectilineatus]
MSDASVPAEDWPAYLRRMTKRPGWSVAKLARESNIHRATIFGWIKGDVGVTIDSVRRIALALGDDPENALRAASSKTDDATAVEQDEEVALIMRAPVDDDLKQVMLQKLRQRREEDKLRRLQTWQDMIDVAPKRTEG